MNDDLKKLLDLQEIDLVIEKINSELGRIPVQIEERKASIRESQKTVETAKQQLTMNHLERKNRELDVAAQDGAISKHEKELNSLKSNEAYKAMLGEIEAAKTKKSETEDAILNLMEESDRLSKEIKETESRARSSEAVLLNEIKDLEEKTKIMNAELEVEVNRRNDFVPQVSPDLLRRYEYIRTRKKSRVIAAISGESCTGCNTALTPSTMNEVKKGKDLVICESCSRILYFAAPQSQTAPA